MSQTISIIVPVFNEAGNIENLFDNLQSTLAEDFEVIFVNDGSTDESLSVIKKIQASNSKVKFLSFTRNFGHQYALRAGIEHAIGDAIVMMDADLQHPVDIIPQMIKRWRDGDKVVYTIRKEPSKFITLKSITSKIFYKFLSAVSDLKIQAGSADFRLIDRSVADVLKGMKEYFFFIRGIVPWLGFKSSSVTYVAKKRSWGKSQFSYTKMIDLAVLGLTSFSTKPITISMYLGFFMSLFSFIYAGYAVWAHFFIKNSVVPGWSSILASILFIGGIQLIVLGVIGHYIGNIFWEIKARPSYVIEESSY